MSPQPSNAGQPNTLDLSRLISAAQATTQALNNLNQTLNAAGVALSGITGTTASINAINATLRARFFSS